MIDVPLVIRMLVLLLAAASCAPSVARAQATNAGTRQTADTDYFVAPSGSDQPGCGATHSAPCATPGYAVDQVSRNVDAAGYQVRVLVDAGNYSTNGAPGLCAVTPSTPHGACAGIELYDVLGGRADWRMHPLLIAGAVGGKPIANGNGCAGPLISFADVPAVLGVGVNSIWELQNVQLVSTVMGIEADRGTRVNVGNGVVFDGCSSPYPTPYKLAAVYKGSIEVIGNVSVYAGGNAFVFVANQGDYIQQAGNVVTFINSPRFVSGMSVAADGLSPIEGLSTAGMYH